MSVQNASCSSHRLRQLTKQLRRNPRPLPIERYVKSGIRHQFHQRSTVKILLDERLGMQSPAHTRERRGYKGLGQRNCMPLHLHVALAQALYPADLQVILRAEQQARGLGQTVCIDAVFEIARRE